MEQSLNSGGEEDLVEMGDKTEILSPQVAYWLGELPRRYPVLEESIPSIRAAFYILRDSLNRGGKLLVCGNGGSAADAVHLSGELLKGFMKKRPVNEKLKAELADRIPPPLDWVERLQGALPVLPLPVNAGLITAIDNDQGPDLIFAQQVLGYGALNDTLLAISTSGSSVNILRAVWVARAKRLKTIGLTGKDGGRLKEWCDHVILAPATAVSEIQELHLPIYHTLAAMLEAAFFP
jgi:D-sedoheptulose 7-phosphate isomerase